MSCEKNIKRETPKIRPIPGFIETRYVKCGRLNCRCASGKGHGPYHYRVHRQGNRKFKEYIKPEDLPYVQACIDQRKQFAKEVAEFNRASKLRWKNFNARVRELIKGMRELEKFAEKEL